MTEYYFDPNDGNVYELPSIEEELARADDEFSFNEDRLMENWRERQENNR